MVREGQYAKRLVLACAISGLVGACEHSGTVSGPAAADNRIEAVATIGMLSEAVARIGGAHVNVRGLMGPGVDPHLYKASQGDLASLRKAQLVVYGGLHLEGKMVEIFERLAATKATIGVGDLLPTSMLLESEVGSGVHDPHIWFDVSLWAKALPPISDALAKLKPEASGEFKKNLAAYLAELAELDAWVRAQLATIEPSQRVLVTAHDAFRYFGRAYGVEVVGLQGISTATEAGLADVADLAKLVVSRKIKAVFVESSVNRKGIEAVIAGAQARGATVQHGGSLFSDALGPAGSPAATYVGMVRENVTTIVAALR